MEIPAALINDVKQGNVVLFLGAGSSIGATDSEGNDIPDARKLADILVNEYLGDEYKGVPLLKAAELAISQKNLFSVQDYIASIFSEFHPAEFHLSIPKFFWTAIYTTNFDLVIQRAYDKVDNGLQNLEPFVQNSDWIDEKLKNEDSIPYTKLHGCITHTRNPLIPLILSTEQYISHRKGRKFLFERFSHHASQFPVVYVGSKIEDFDIRAILYELKENETVLPRSYIVLPSFKPAEKTFWESNSISCLEMTFEEFLSKLDGNIPKEDRGKRRDKTKDYCHPICSRFKEKDVDVPDAVKTLLSRDVEYVNADIKPNVLLPQQFYKGYFKDFAPIINKYDIRRQITDSIIAEVFLEEEIEKDSTEEFILLRGHAGSGKSVLLRRIAWDSAVDFDRLCLWINTELFPDYEAVKELHRICEERIFVFIDPVNKYQEVIQLWLSRARKDKLPLTIIGAERNHEWNIACAELHPFTTEIFDLAYLKEKEIEELLIKLKEYKCLGYLEGLSVEKQKEEFVKRAGRQLLVALYEATLGKGFPEIILDEYNSIASTQAKSMYLTISVLHRLNIPVRAGLISRIHNITFGEFMEKLFKPLELIIFAYEDRFIRDYVYVSRHPMVSEMLFEQALSNEQDRFNEYMRLINAMDIGYSSDRSAFTKLINARQLISLFKDPQLIRRIFNEVKQRLGEDAHTLQQEGIFEMHSSDGSIEKAGELIRNASSILPNSKVIKHSLSEWALKKSETAKTELERIKYVRESQRISLELTREVASTSFPFHTLIKIGIEELIKEIKTGDSTTIERKIGEVERIIANAQQHFPEDSYILAEESKYRQYISDDPQAKKLLEKAFENNKGNPYVAIRLADFYEQDDSERAIEVLSEAIDVIPGDKPLNYKLAILLQKYKPERKADIKIHLKRAFTDGDSNYAAQFWYARHIYLEELIDDAYKYFKILGKAYLDPQVKNLVRGIVMENEKPVLYRGIIEKKEPAYGFIKRDQVQDNIFIHSNNVNEKIWEELKKGNRVIFELGFSYKGPQAINVKRE